MKREYLFYGLGYLVFVLVFMAPLGVAFKRELDEKQTAKVLAEKKRAGIEREKLASEAVDAMVQRYPQRSGIMAENEIPKIARGTTGQAKLEDLPYDNPLCEPDFMAPMPGSWQIAGPDTSGGYGPADDGGDYTNGWDITVGGAVTVPLNALPGRYVARITDSESCGYDEEGEANMLPSYFYEFEVVCMKVTITAAPSGGSGNG